MIIKDIHIYMNYSGSAGLPRDDNKLKKYCNAVVDFLDILCVLAFSQLFAVDLIKNGLLRVS